jgi:hypothetical protein
MMGDVRANYKPDAILKDTSTRTTERSAPTDAEYGTTSDITPGKIIDNNDKNISTASNSNSSVNRLGSLVQAAQKVNRYSPDDALLSKPKHLSKLDKIKEVSNDNEYIALHRALLKMIDSNH